MKNEIIILGTLHSQHFKSGAYDLHELRAIVESIDPDVVLAETSPDRSKIAGEEFRAKRVILDERITVYSKCTRVIFPLTESMPFELIPVSAGTEKMALGRDKKMNEL